MGHSKSRHLCWKIQRLRWDVVDLDCRVLFDPRPGPLCGLENHNDDSDDDLSGIDIISIGKTPHPSPDPTEPVARVSTIGIVLDAWDTIIFRQ